MALASPGTFWACQIVCLHISVTRWRRCTHQLCSGSSSDLILRSRTPTNDRSEIQNSNKLIVLISRMLDQLKWHTRLLAIQLIGTALEQSRIHQLLVQLPQLPRCCRILTMFHFGQFSAKMTALSQRKTSPLLLVLGSLRLDLGTQSRPVRAIKI